MKKREVGSLFLHVGIGAALAALVCWNVWFMVLATFIYAFLREQAQHRWIHTAEIQLIDGTRRVYYIKKRTFWDFGWVTWHRIWEVLQWTLGSAIGILLLKRFVHG